MNKIYKVVWNTVRNCYVVGSELISSKSGRHSTSNGKSSSLKVTLTVLALCGMTALGSGLVPAYAADAGTAVESQYVAVLVNDKNNYYYTSWGRQVSYGDKRTFDGYSYHKETVSGETYWVRDGYTIKYEENERYPGARKDNIIKAYKTDSYTASSDTGLLKSNQIMIESAGISTLTGVDLDDVSGGTYVGASNSGSTSTPSSFNYMIKDDNGSYVDAGNTNFSTRFKVATKNTDGTYSYNGEVIANDNLYVVNNQVGVFLTASGKVYTGKVFGANNEVLMTTKSDEGTMYSYWGADTPDPNTKLADMTIGQFNQALEKVNNNSKAVAGDTIKEIKTTAKTDGGTIDLVRRGQYNSATGQYEGEYTVGKGITITSHGGTNGEDVKINFSNDNGKTGFDVAAGSKVSAIGTTDATTGLTINGVDYTIKAGKDYKAGANIQISDDNTISANDNYVTGGSISGDTITLNRVQGGDVTITGLKDYVEGKDSYVTSASLKDNKLTITQNNDKGNYVIDLSDFANQFSGTDYRVVANPAEGSNGIYRPDASGNIELTVQDAKTGTTSKVQLSDVASVTTVTNNYNTLNTKIDDTKTDITNAYTTKINDTKTTITNEYQKYVKDNEDYVTSGSIKDDTITLKRALGGEVTITGLKDYVEGLDSYVTSASLKDNKLTITQNNDKGNYVIDLSDFANQFSGTDYRVVANPAEGSNGIYRPDASGNIELTVQDAKTGTTSKVQLSDVASVTTVTNNYNTLNTKIDDTKTDITNAYTTKINDTKTTITNEYQKYVKDNEDYVTSGSIKDDTITLKRALGGEVTITGLKDYVEGLDSYVTSASLKDNKLTITQNNDKGNYVIDLSDFANQFSGTDYRVVANPAEGSNGIYKPDASGNIELTVQDAKTGATSTVKLSDVASAETVTNNYNTLNTKVDAAKTTLANGTNTTVESSTAEDGHIEYKVNLNTNVNLNDTIQLNGSDGSISATSGTSSLNFNDQGLALSNGSDSTVINGGMITVNGGDSVISGTQATFGKIKLNAESGASTISGLSNTTTKYDGFATAGRAATEEQLKEVDSKATAAKTTVTAGKNIEVKGQSDENGSAYTVGLADDVSLGNGAIQLKGSDGSISATSGTSSLNFNDKGLSLSNGTNSTVINGGTITVNGGDSVISGTQATFGKIKLNAESGSTITGLTNTTTKYDGFATAGRAATEEQLSEVAGKASEAIETAGQGWNLTTNGKDASKTNIKPGGTVDFSSGNDNLVISNAGADLSFSLSDNLDLTNNKDKKGSVKVGENTALSNELLQVGKDVSLTASALNVGTSSLTTSALMVGGLTYINSSGINANGNRITRVADGIAPMDAVNVRQLKSAISGSQISIKAGDGISVNKAGNQYTINVNIEGLSNEHGTVHVSTDSDPSVVSKSTPTESETITPAPAKRMNSLLLAEEAVVAEPENSTSTGKKMYVKYTSNEVKLITDDITNPEEAVTLNDGEKIDFVGGKNITTSSNQGTDTDGKNYDKITFSLKDDISVTSVTADKVTINNGPTINENGIDMNGKNITNTESITVNNGPTINSSGIDMNSQKITKLAEGDISETSTDAVNGSQLYATNQRVTANTENINNLTQTVNNNTESINTLNQTVDNHTENINILNEAVTANAENINSLSHSLNKLDSRINRVGAGAAALAALHPLDFDPDNKWDFAAGYGNYAGANAVAIGTYYRPNENTMFSIGGSFGGGENMINAGVSFKLGSGGSGITTSKTVMAKKIKEQDELLKAQDAKMKEQDEKIAKLEALVAQQGEMIQQALGKK